MQLNTRNALFPLALTASLGLASPAMATPGGGSSCTQTPLEKINPLPGGHGLGRHVDLSGDVLVAGGYVSSTEGGAIIFVRDQAGHIGSWGIAKTLGTSAGPNSSFGHVTAVSCDTVVVASHDEIGSGVFLGTLYIYERDLGGAGNWGLSKMVTDPSGGTPGFASSLAIDGDVIVAGTPQGIGSAVVLRRDLGGPDNWGLEATILPSSPTAVDFGNDVAIQGDTIVIADYQDSELGFFGGKVTVCERIGGVWTETGEILAPNGLGGQAFGGSVDLDGDRLIVGAYTADAGGVQNEGAAWIFGRDQGGPENWGALEKLAPSDGMSNTRFGLSVAISGEYALVGGPTWSGNCTNEGRIYLFARDLGGAESWDEVENIQSPADCGDRFGDSVALDGQVAVAGAPNMDGTISGAGAVYVFADVASGCTAPYCTAGTTSNGCTALMSASGTPSTSAGSGFLVSATGVEGERQGILFFSTAGTKSTPWGAGSSRLCVQGPTQRTGTQSSNGNAGACNGTLDLDFNVYMNANPGKAPAAGSEVFLQAWFRDPPSPKTTSLSNALRFTVTP